MVYETIFQIIEALGSLATVCAFIFLFRRDKDKQEQIDTLKSLLEIDKRRLDLSVLPHLWSNSSSFIEATSILQIEINNKGEFARLDDVKLNSQDFIINSKITPYDIDKGNSMNIYARKNSSKELKDCEFEFFLEFSDKLDNKYLFSLLGKGAKVEKTSTKKISPVPNKGCS